VLVQPEEPFFGEGGRTLQRRASRTRACGTPGLREVRERLCRVAPLGCADRTGPGVRGPRGEAEGARARAGTAGVARASEKVEAECRRLRAPGSGAPPRREEESTRGYRSRAKI
ncbi:MAG: hypothetical protein AVDCRST_MAG05-4388, partial [uncultured Rubrobacteraceae bacterium]